MGYERGENYKNKNSSQGIFSRKVKCPFMLRIVSNGISWKVTIRCGIHNHELANGLVGHNILGHLKSHEIHFMNEMKKYNMAPRFIVVTLKDRNHNNMTSTTQVYKARSTSQSTIRGPFTKNATSNETNL